MKKTLNEIKDKNLFLLIASVLINNIGDVLFDFFIVWMALVSSSGVIGAVIILSSSILFRACVSFFVGVLIDRFNKLKVILVVNTLSVFIIFVFYMNYDYLMANIVFAVMLILLNNINNEFFSKSTLLLASLNHTKEEFIVYQSTISVGVRILGVAGTALVGLMIDHVPTILFFMINGLTFILSSVLIVVYARAKKDLRDRINKDKKGNKKTIRNQIKEALHYGVSNTHIRFFIIIMLLLNLVFAFVPQVMPLIISSNLNLEAADYGFIKSSLFIGEIIGLVIVGFIGKKVNVLFFLSLFGSVISLIVLGISSSLIIVIGAYFLYGLFDSLSQPFFSNTIVMIDEDKRGAVIGAIDALILFVAPIGMWVGTILSRISFIWALGVMIVIYLIGILILMIYLKDVAKEKLG